MTPFELLSALDDAIARTPRRPRNRVALELRRSPVLGHDGVLLGQEPDGSPVYGYTRHQCYEMRAVILAAAADDARSADG